MTPRLAVTQEQAQQVLVCRDDTCPCRDGDLCHYVADGDTPAMRRSWPVTLRLPKRPTMPCPKGTGKPRYYQGAIAAWWDCEDCDGSGRVPIPEGARIEVVYPCDCSEHQPGMRVNTAMCPHNRTGGMVPVAFATLTEVKPVEGYWPDDDYWLVTLSDLRPIDG